MDSLMLLAIEESRVNGMTGQGGPFGAVIAREGIVIAQAHNRVLETNDPTMHAEIAAIRLACKKLGRFDLSDCVIYSSCEPCPMCLAAIMWAKIRKCFYACTRDDAAAIGFDDCAIYNYIAGNKSAVDFTAVPRGRGAAFSVMKEWAESSGRRMY